MTIIRRPSPFGELMSLRQAMDRLFEDSYVRPTRSLFGGLAELLPLDIRHDRDELVVQAALPGVKPEDVEITLNVPIHFLNEASAKGVKEQGGVVNHLLTDVEVRCLPRYLPEYLEVDVTPLELNQIFHLSDIKLPEGVTLVALAHGNDQPVVAINPPREEEVEAPVEAATPAGEVPATAQAEPAKAEEGAAGGKAKGGKDKA